MAAKKRSINSSLRKIDRHVIQPEEYEDAPEWTAQDFESATLRQGNKVIRRGRPSLPIDERKKAITLRLDPGVIEAYRATGAGWQARINEDLRKTAKRLKA
jgi:uncharacterized protein (DUF4415 family)